MARVRRGLPPLTLVRVAFAYGTALAAGWAWNRARLMPGKVGTLASSTVIGIVFLVACVVTGELRPSQLKQLRAKKK